MFHGKNYFNKHVSQINIFWMYTQSYVQLMRIYSLACYTKRKI